MNEGQASIKLEIGKGSEFIDITQIVESVEWSGAVNEAYRTLSVSYKNTLDGRKRAINIENGDRVRFSNNGRELFRGRIFAFDVDDKGSESFTAFDTNVYLTKSMVTRKFKNITASAIVRRLATEYGVTPGQIDDTGYVIPKLVIEEKTVYETILMALTLTEKQNGRRFILVNRDGKVHLLERKKQTVRQVIENGVNLLSASYSQSIEDMRNRVIVYGGDKEKGELSASETNRELINKYGYMVHIERVQDVKESEIKQLAKQRLKELATINDEATVDALGIDDVIAGSAIYAKESMSGIIGGFYVSADSHTYSKGAHTMSLTLTATDDLPRLEYNESEAVR